MPISKTTRKLSIGLLAVPESSAAVIYGLHEVFSCVGTVWQMLTGDQVRSREMQPRIIGRSTESMQTTLRVPLVPDGTYADRAVMDVVIVPDLFLEPDPDLSDRWPYSSRKEGFWMGGKRQHIGAHVESSKSSSRTSISNPNVCWCPLARNTTSSHRADRHRGRIYRSI